MNVLKIANARVATAICLNALATVIAKEGVVICPNVLEMISPVLVKEDHAICQSALHNVNVQVETVTWIHV